MSKGKLLFKNISSEEVMIMPGGSKSISNRLLILCFLYNFKTKIVNVSNADDTVLLSRLLSNNRFDLVDCNNAGTVFRFLLGILPFVKGKKIITGSKRMLQRPIKPLVDALVQLGTPIQYLAKNDFPPLLVGHIDLQNKTNTVNVDATMSSQFTSALLLSFPKFGRSMTVQLEGNVVSRPYLEMTIKLLQEFGASVLQSDNRIEVFPQLKGREQYFVESDWSSASYFYAHFLLNKKINSLKLYGLSEKSLQGDSVISQIMQLFGIQTIYNEDHVQLFRIDNYILPRHFEFDLTNYPDLAPTLAVVLAVLEIPSVLIGIQTLKYKESDRAIVLMNELNKLDSGIAIIDDQFILQGNVLKYEANKELQFETYDDHRMAMAFSLLCYRVKNLRIQNTGVVSKSCPNFWNELKKIGVYLE